MKNRIATLSLLLALGASPVAMAETGPTIDVYKSPTCGCCEGWVNHLKENGFTVSVTDTVNLNPIKEKAGLTPALASCHTGFVNGYAIEGHVPAADIRKLLADAPDAAGLSVPGMPLGSPGMEMGDRKMAYNVMLFNRDGQTRVFARH